MIAITELSNLSTAQRKKYSEQYAFSSLSLPDINSFVFTQNNNKNGAEIDLNITTKNKQNIPIISKRISLDSLPTTYYSSNYLPDNERISYLEIQKFLLCNQNKQIRDKRQHTNWILQTTKPKRQCFSPKYLKEREQNQRILQSLKLENQKHKRLIQQNPYLNKKRININISQFQLFASSKKEFQNQKIKKISKRQSNQARKALQQMTNLTSSFVVNEKETNNCFRNQFLGQKKSQKVLKNLSKQNFEKIKFLGKGNFGQVNLVRHKETNFICAMKTIKKSFVREEKVVHQISRQIRIHMSLKHLNIISFYGFFDDNQNVYILLEYATGGELYKKLKECYRMPESEISPIIKDALDGLNRIHSLGYIHRDIKPQNMIFQFGIGKICDLGWAAQCGHNQMRKSYCGTPLYLPPEMVQKQNYDQSADIWSLGVLTYQLIVGKVPFNIWSQFDLKQIVQKDVVFPTSYVDMSQKCIDFIKKCLNKSPSQRLKIQQLMNHPFITEKPENGYFNVQIYNAIENLF